MQDKNAFTLVEVLVVLSILGIMLILIVPINYMFLEKQKEKQFIKMFSSDILFMQAYSRTSPAGVLFEYSNKNQKYKIYRSGLKSIIERDIPKGWEIKMRTFKELRFTYSGSISKLGTIVLKTKHHTYKFIFSLGKGRFRIEKE